ncbi:hypothetical protein G5T42_02380 [Microbacterium sp. 4R-513]|uniref:hypothetical protein n=1 Tax=Microbacterium sp. 4R-513 TaxID=2567934 RepID=UPI0013E15BF4|nr:hypothetical protein [Microbacterium sp. 4R-513]QIG38469.1 hypothetical protein G5T42_02380 [Microbacterium sp. 4R-513]
MDAMTFAASRLGAYRDAELQREIALRAAHARRAEARATTTPDGGPAASVCVQGDLALAGPSS